MVRTQDGSMLVWAMFSLVLVSGFLFAGMEGLRATSVDVDARFRAQGQALDVARAGIVDAYAWCRRQTSQPVTVFAPQRDMAAIPPVNETEDPAVGIVRQFQITPGYFARYEVRRWADANGNGRGDPGEGMYDTTANRGLAGAGTAWHIESHGYVFRRLDPSVAWNVAPNERVAAAVVSTEVRRMALIPPSAAAVCIARDDALTVGAKGRVDGVAAGGAIFPPSTGTPSATGELKGTPASGSVTGYAGSWSAVFGMTADELKGLASISMSGTQALPDPFPEYGLVFVEGDLTATAAAPLRGTGILAVRGNLTLAAGSNSYFTGFVYVSGNYAQSAPSIVRGTVVVGGTAAVSGSSDFAEVVYDADVLDQLVQQIGCYRISRAMHRLDRDDIRGVR